MKRLLLTLLYFCVVVDAISQKTLRALQNQKANNVKVNQNQTKSDLLPSPTYLKGKKLSKQSIADYYNDDYADYYYYDVDYLRRLRSRRQKLRQLELQRRKQQQFMKRKQESPVADRKASGDDYYYDDYYYDDDLVNEFTTRNDGYSSSDSGGGLSPLALLIAPIAGIALLSAAAAVSLNPVLVSISLSGRKKREIEDDKDIQMQMHQIRVLERFLHAMPNSTDYQKKVLSMYLMCSGYKDAGNPCIERVACEYADEDTKLTREEKDVVSIVLYHVMNNDYIEADYKTRLKNAAVQGRKFSKSCPKVYQCQELNEYQGVRNDGQNELKFLTKKD